MKIRNVEKLPLPLPAPILNKTKGTISKFIVNVMPKKEETAFSGEKGPGPRPGVKSNIQTQDHESEASKRIKRKTKVS
jgi:hypothetical protein